MRYNKNKSKLSIATKPSRNLTVSKFNKGINAKLAYSVLDFDVAQFAYNFDFDSGVLTEGIGVSNSDIVEQQPLENGVMSVWLYNKRVPEVHNFLMIASLDGKVYYRDLDTQDGFELLQDIELTSRPKAVVYRLNGYDTIIITTATDGMYTWDGVGVATKIGSVPLITSMTIHSERMFVTTADHTDAVWFSEDLDPTNFGTDLNEGGFIELIDERGIPQLVLSYLNYVYVFREYGITRLTAYGGQEEFGASNLFVSSGKIYPRTVVLCGDSIVFLASDGLYMFDGMTTMRILDNLTSLIVPSPQATAVFANGKYYLALSMNFDEPIDIVEQGSYSRQRQIDSNKLSNNSMIVLDTSSGNYSISRGFEVADLIYFANYNQVIVVLQNGSVGKIALNGSVFDKPLLKLWRVGMTDLSLPYKTKNIRQIDIHTKHDIELVCRTENKIKTFSAIGKDTITRIRLNLQCKLFGMDIVCRGAKAFVSRPSVKVVVVG